MIHGDAVVYELTYPHPPERVWQALAEPGELAAWLMPVDGGNAAAAGERFTMVCDPFGTIKAEVIEADPPWRLSWRWDGSFGETVVVFELAPEGSGTRLGMEHRGWTDGNAGIRDQFDSGWNTKLALLADAAIRPSR